MRFKPLVLSCIVACSLSGCGNVIPWSYYNQNKDKINIGSPNLVNYLGWYFERPEGFAKQDRLNTNEYFYLDKKNQCAIEIYFDSTPYKESAFLLRQYSAISDNLLNNFSGAELSKIKTLPEHNHLNGYRLDFRINNKDGYLRGMNLYLMAFSDFSQITVYSANPSRQQQCLTAGQDVYNSMVYLGRPQ
ncbi:hypothetical protein [Succinatimonas hippei]|uniref:hypothetical protein n=1 Tax=Succinatimonas hippei TaxID=626938 RepID=UPI00249340C6|nr:hypothetical protein [Succinatimonas hippei]